MRNLFAFIRRYAVLLFFLLLEVLSMTLLFRYNKYHQAVYMDVASEITGSLQGRYNRMESYFYLRKENEDLRRRLAELQNRLPENFELPDTAVRVVTDTVRWDTLRPDSRKFIYQEARVVNNSIIHPNNYITLHRGSKQGVAPGMVVIGANGVVGLVLDVTDNFSTVMSMLSRQSRISGRLKKTGETGRVDWDGKDPRMVQFRDIPQSVKVAVGDTVYTSQYSDFPPGILIGTVQEVIPEQSTNNFLIQLRTSTDFSRLQHAFVIANLQRNEQLELEQKTRQKK
ncbi:MAG TPA: rod shape-determining protein MreC [Lacibacter sp.]|nr:rod shape-determining protein MreC [Lacibacter sp.]HMO88740.1 rod shape-determining protein MreC [Lacibacter sp.]